MGKLYDSFLVDIAQNFNIYTLPDLEVIKKNITTDNLSKLLDYSKEIFSYKLTSVVDTKPEFLKKYAQVDPHDYFSIGLYYHENPNTENGLPFISIDGNINKNNVEYNKLALRQMGFIGYIGSLATYFSNDKSYIDTVLKHFRHFFIDERTKMNPNLEHSQMIPGINKGRGIGIIDYASVHSSVLVMFKNLFDKGLLEVDFYNEYASWLKEFKVWLIESKNGLDECNALNNHGTMYDELIISINYYLGIKDTSLISSLEKRLESQIEEDGSMPKEFARTRSLSYTLMNLRAFTSSYKLLGVKKEEINKNLFKSIEYLKSPIIFGLSKWDYNQLDGSFMEYFRLFPIFELIYNYDYKFSIDFSNIENSYTTCLLIDSIK